MLLFNIFVSIAALANYALGYACVQSCRLEGIDSRLRPLLCHPPPSCDMKRLRCAALLLDIPCCYAIWQECACQYLAERVVPPALPASYAAVIADHSQPSRAMAFICLQFGCPTKISPEESVGASSATRICPRCHNPSITAASSRRWFEFCFIPLIPFKKKHLWLCTICQWRSENAQDGNGPPIAGGGGPQAVKQGGGIHAPKQ
ncbi:uncharacterized protein L969DRAFT_45718 [Mixia osmundae IAM 14324]|uniref:Zinc-ribbon 15 domain-containing protein n=1 Tax=Mixia osmundae (strain CBS 9802 / IAM 14324 / JCM 22182 / KY 12970) TaxID=764103 RepID=G7DU00_MIXOS|nr:uncharacterized protein L969DRAFT_45718 [Mixia osmundae IAM 14324]KEI41773.1 hypothetical protein L969DRAFT_45718 [Mixia osmundae IAM 14324]GAA94060.1 hypothetical protein E5Q_00707 [Mixia osmundae IAM 14324]